MGYKTYHEMLNDDQAEREAMSDKPMVITLCGSTRFPDAFHMANMHYTMLGCVVISLGVFGHADFPMGGKFLTSDGDETTKEKVALDKLHFAKIDLADMIVVINVGGYIGNSTRKEIEYAKKKGIAIRFLFPQAGY